MKWKTLLMAVAILAMAAGTGMADMVYTPQPANYDFGVGVYNPNDKGSLNTVYVTSGNGLEASDSFAVTFALHMNAIFYYAESLHFSFIYDNSVLEVVRATPVNAGGVWLGSNYADLTANDWPNPSSGVSGFVTLTQNVGTGTSFISLPTSAIVPFMQVTFHVKDGVQKSDIGQFGITVPPYTAGGGFGVGMTLVSHSFALTLFPDRFAYFGGSAHVVPEPATMTLIGGFLASLGGLVIRRRRRG